MAQSFTLSDHKPPIEARGKRRRVLVTGAAGKIGSYFAEHSHKRYDLRLMVHHSNDAKKVKSLRRFGQIVTGDTLDLGQMKQNCKGIDTVVHFAADPSPSATWESVLRANIVGAYNIFVAAKAAGCRRVIYASSIHAVSGYPPEIQVKTNEPVNPGDIYGVSKCFGEAMGRYMAEQEDLSCIVIRIGAFQPRSAAEAGTGIGMLDAWVSHRDLNQLLERSIDVEGLRFAILHGLSGNRFNRMDITDTCELVGYRPQDDFTQVNELLRPLELRKRIMKHTLKEDAVQKSGIREDLTGKQKIRSTKSEIRNKLK